MCGCPLFEDFGAQVLADYPRQGADTALKRMSSERVAMRTLQVFGCFLKQSREGAASAEWEQTGGWIQTKTGATRREQQIGSEDSLNQNEISAA